MEKFPRYTNRKQTKKEKNLCIQHIKSAMQKKKILRQTKRFTNVHFTYVCKKTQSLKRNTLSF